MTIYLNAFPVTIADSVLHLPVRVHDSEQARNDHKRQLPKSSQVVDLIANSEGYRTACIRCQDTPDGYTSQRINLFDQQYIAPRIALSAISAGMQSREHFVRRRGLRTQALHQDPTVSFGLAHVRSGVEFYVEQPFQDTLSALYLVARWITPIEFTESIAHPTLRSISLGKGVIYRPGSDGPAVAIKKFTNKYLGQVRRLTSTNSAIVKCRDRQERELTLSHLFLEGNPSNLHAYERASQTPGKRARFWNQVLKAQFVLDQNGRRNLDVLRQQISATRESLFGPEKADSIQNAPYPASTQVTVRSVPTTVEDTHYV